MGTRIQRRSATNIALAAAIALGAMTVATPRAHAFDPQGFALGASASLGGVTGFEGVYWLSPMIGLDFLVGSALTAPRMGDAVFNFRAAFGLWVNLMRWNQTNFGLGGRAGIGASSAAAGDPPIDLSFEAALRGEHMFDDHFGINAVFGIVGVGHINQDPVFNLNVGSAVGPFGSLGFLFYFDSIAAGAAAHTAPTPAPAPAPAYTPPPPTGY